MPKIDRFLVKHLVWYHLEGDQIPGGPEGTPLRKCGDIPLGGLARGGAGTEAWGVRKGGKHKTGLLEYMKNIGSLVDREGYNSSNRS